MIASMLQEASVPLSTKGDASVWCCDSHGWGCSIWLTSVGSCDENRWKDVVAASSRPCARLWSPVETAFFHCQQPALPSLVVLK